MKNILHKAVIALLFSLVFSSCDDDDNGYKGGEWDFINVLVAVNVVDENGNNLMDPSTENSIAGNDIKVTYLGETHNLDEDIETKSRYNKPIFRGLVSYNEYYKHFQYGLFFGEFAAEDNIDKEEIVIDWGDGSKKDIIILDHKFWWEKKDKPKMETTFYLNGKKVNGDYITIVK